MKQLLLALALTAPLGLGACAGFQPMHATAESQIVFNDLTVMVEDGEDEGDRELGYMIRQRLADRIAVNGEDASYLLVVEPRLRRVGLGLTAFDQASLFDSIAQARWTLTSSEDGSVIARGRVQGEVSYSASRDPYQLLITTEQANERAANEAASKLIDSVTNALAELPT
jgi:LPS-assembly lipoprotein